MNVIGNILSKSNSGKLNKILSSVGLVMGIVLITLTLEFYFDYKNLTNQSQEDALNADFLVITKEINELHTSGILTTAFNDKEINNIESKDFFTEVKPFIKNNYEAFIESKNDEFPLKFSSLVTFEAIPNHFIDVKTDNWNWNETSTYLPVIVPRSYINMYNFGMADVQGLPVISENLISNFTVSLNIKGNGYTQSLDTKIVGFSDRIQSVLVPESFLTYSNKKFGNKELNKVSKLIASSKDASNPELAKFLEKKGYVTNKEMLKGTKSNTLLQLVFSFILFIGLLVVFLSILNFVQQAQLKIEKTSANITKLIQIGYYYKQLSKVYYKKLILQFSITLTIGFMLALLIKALFIIPFAQSYLTDDFNTYINLQTVLFFIILIVLISIYIFTKINNSFKKLAT